MRMNAENVAAAAAAGKSAFESRVEVFRTQPQSRGRDPHMAPEEVERHIEAARTLLFGEDGNSGIASKLAATRNTADTVRIIRDTVTNVFFKQPKTTGLLAMDYLLSYSSTLKELEPEYLKAFRRDRGIL